MMKPLDELLADLSLRARKAEEAISAARKETSDGVTLRREAFRAAAAAAADRVDRDLRSAGTKLEGDWARLADRASRKESEACVAIDFAVASIENAKLAVLDAVIADREAAAVRERQPRNLQFRWTQ